MAINNIYFLQAKNGGPIKIGFSYDCDKRLKSHQTSHWEELIIVLLIKNCHQTMEYELHSHFKQYRIRGEWFKEEIFYDIIALENKIYLLSCPHRGEIEKKKYWLFWCSHRYRAKYLNVNKNRRLVGKDNRKPGKKIESNFCSKEELAEAMQKAWGDLKKRSDIIPFYKNIVA